MGGAVAVMFWSMLPDTVEYGQWRSRIRDDGIVFGLSQLISKAGSGLECRHDRPAAERNWVYGGIDQSAETLQAFARLHFESQPQRAHCPLVIPFYPLD